MSNTVLFLIFLLSIPCIAHASSAPIISTERVKLVQEDFPVGDVLFWLNATDSDGDTVTFSLVTEETRNLVTLNHTGHNSAQVILKSELDSDYEPDGRYLHFSATDGTYDIPVTVYLVINDVNDERPVFDQPGYRVTVKESELDGFSVLNITAHDPDTRFGGLVFFGLQPKRLNQDEFKFVIDAKTGEIKLNGTLDFRTVSYYQYDVTAWDFSANESLAGNHALPVDFSVAIQDVQDTPPFFRNLPYIPTVDENVVLNTTLMMIQASDGDQGTPNPIKYAIERNSSTNHEYFAVDEHTGIITIIKELDVDTPELKQKGGVMHFRIVAYEEFNSSQVQNGETSVTTQVTVTVRDVNDNKPTFTSNQIIARIPENTNSGVQVSMATVVTVEDVDFAPENNLFILSVEQNGLPYLDFDTIDGSFSQTSVIIRIQNSSILDYEQRENITFQIVARETSSSSQQSSTANVVVLIEDVNDNKPTFEDSLYVYNVAEDADVNDVLGNISATDNDDGKFGKIFYKIEDGSTDFNISKDDGVIHLSTKLNRERSAYYSLKILACDNEGDENQQLTGTTVVNIHVMDVNDNSPVFEGNNASQSVPITLSEDIDLGTVVATVRAQDDDEGDNSIVEYYIYDDSNVSNRFAVDVVFGVVNVTASLIGYTGTRFIELEARDKGLPSRSGFRRLIFSIRDVNLNSPNFTHPSGDFDVLNPYVLSVLEESAINSALVTLIAEDADSGDNGKVAYRIEPSAGQDWTYFQIDANNGSLSNVKRLDREVIQELNIQVSAQDHGQPILKTTLPIKIKFVDIDDNGPEFPDSITQPHNVVVSEGPLDDILDPCFGNLDVAVDKDFSEHNRQNCYYILNGDEAFTSSLVLNKSTAVLCLIKELDREERPSFDITILVATNCSLDGTPTHPFTQPDVSNSSLLWVKVTVEDKNDNPPVVAGNGELSTGMLYDTDVGVVIYNLRDDVRDLDQGINAVTYFRDLEQTSTDIDGTKNKPFYISTNGSVSTNTLFSSSMLGYVDVIMEAFDMDNTIVKCSLKIYIISNIQRVKVIFDKTPEEVRLIKYDLIRELEGLLNYRIIADKITSHRTSADSTESHMTDMFIHARYNGTEKPVPAEELWRAFDFTPGVSLIFMKYGVTGTQPVVEAVPHDDLSRVLTLSLILVAAFLSITVVALASTLYFMKSKYSRRLRAATTSSIEKFVEKSFAPPGTNLYTSTNPVYMKNVSLADEVSHCSDSLDDNAVDGCVDDTNQMVQEVVLMIDEESIEENMTSSQILDNVLQQYAEIERQGDKQTLIEETSDGDSGTFNSVPGLEHSDI